MSPPSSLRKRRLVYHRISWSSIPAGGKRTNITPEQRRAEVSNICARATARVDQCCKQPLRATTDTLMLYGPGTRVGVRQPGPAVLITKRWPVLDIVSVQVARNCLPYVWTTVPAALCQVQNPVSGLYGSIAPTAAGEGGQGILISKEYVNLNYGPGMLAIQVKHVNGWPHCGITADAEADASELQVDDCTAWATTSALTGYTGATGTVYDAGAQEVIHVTAASAAAGPGTLTLASPLQFPHDAGVMVSTMTENVGWAAILYACVIALERGATATGVMEIPGRVLPGGSSGDPEKDAAAILCDYRRII